MNWKPILPKIISSYKNGNHIVTIYSDGTKVKETIDTNADHFTYDKPESFDLKITDYCDGGCKFCAENSTTNGKHANLTTIHNLMGSCKKGTEVAIGGGNALAHPDIVNFVYYLRSLGLIPSITVNQAHLKPYYEVLMDVKKAGIAGVGISLTDPNNFEDFRIIDKLGDNAVIHVIAGILKPSDYKALYGRKVLILGYKDFRRGHDNLLRHSDEIKKNIEQLKKDLPMLVDKCRAISFDCLGLEQIDPKTVLGISDEEFYKIYQGDDYDMYDKDGNISVGSMFIDAVRMEVARSSTTPLEKRVPFTGKENIGDLLSETCWVYSENNNEKTAEDEKAILGLL